MDNEKTAEFAADLLGYYMGLCDQQERDEIEQRLQQQPELSVTLSRLPSLLAPLDYNTVENPSADLNQRIKSRLAALNKSIPIRAAVSASPSIDRGTNRDRPFITMRELTGLAAAITVFVGLVVPGYRSARMAGRQAACANNLRMFGNGLVNYAQVNSGQFPFVGVPPQNAYWAKPTNAMMPIPVTFNSRNVFQLIPGHFVEPGALVCPACPQDVALKADSIGNISGFPSPHNISYATNFVTSPWSQQTLQSQMPIAADRSPLVDANGLIVPNPSPNSTVHGQFGGQNVLTGQNSVFFSRTPNVGIEHDDIYRVYGVQQYTGQERPRLRSDAFLVP